MTHNGPRAFETEATRVGDIMNAGLNERPYLVSEVQSLEAQHASLGARLATKRAALDVLQNPVDLEDHLVRVEARAVSESDVPLFVFARNLRHPYYETIGEELDAKEMGRIGQIQAHQAALSAAHDYEQLGDFLSESTEPVPFMRLSKFSYNQYRERVWGNLVLGWLEPGAAIGLNKLRIEGEPRYAEHLPEAFTLPVVYVADIQVAGRVEHQSESGIDPIDRWAFWPVEGAEINLMDGKMPTEVPKEAPEPQTVVPVNSIEASSSFLVGEECFRFLEIVRAGSSRWRVGDDRTLFTDGVAAMQEVLTTPITYEEAREALVL